LAPALATTNPRLAQFKSRAAGDAQACAIDITRRGAPLGRLVTALPPLPEADLASLSQWRNAHRTAFFSERLSTPASTAAWLASIAQREDRILFLIAGPAGATVGHIGLNHVDEAAGRAESDAWLGIGDARAPGLMLAAFATLLDWAFGTLGLQAVDAQVFSDNAKVLRAHEMLGFRLLEVVPFRRSDSGPEASWEPGDGAVRRPVSRLQLARTDFEPRAAGWR